MTGTYKHNNIGELRTPGKNCLFGEEVILYKNYNVNILF